MLPLDSRRGRTCFSQRTSEYLFPLPCSSMAWTHDPAVMFCVGCAHCLAFSLATLLCVPPPNHKVEFIFSIFHFSGVKENALPPECFTHSCICASVSRDTFHSSSTFHFCYKHWEKEKSCWIEVGNFSVLVAKRNCQRAILVSLICVSHLWWIWNNKGIYSWFLSFSLQTGMAKHFFLEKRSVTLEIRSAPAPTSIFVCRCAVYI